MIATVLPVAETLDVRIRIAAVVATAVMFFIVLELVRRRRLAERYAILWMAVATVLLIFAIWTGLLSTIADVLGIAVPANALFIASIGVAFLLLLHFSVISSRLSEETKILAQEVARLDAELRARDAALRNGQPESDAGRAGAAESPRSARTADQ